MLLILEGPDGAGKSTLASQLLSLHPGADVVHHGPAEGLGSRDLAATYMRAIRPALRGSRLIFDRSWLSEPIYAAVYRKQASRITSAQRRMLERAALVAGGVVIKCLPPFEQCLEAFSSGRDELLESDTQLQMVYEAYATSMPTHLPVVQYDYTRQTVDDVLYKAAEAAAAAEPKIILLGDRVPVKSEAHIPYAVPFVSFREDAHTTWFAEQLDSIDCREQDLAWWSAYTHFGVALNPQDLPDLPIIALGSNADYWCFENNVACHTCENPALFFQQHPGRRYPLLDILKELL